jgi:hypothetical protein
MDYTYLLEEKAQQIDDTRDIHILHLLCYNVNVECKYPFLQFMMDKSVKEELTLPHIIINYKDCDILEEIVKHISRGQKNIEYKGLIEYKGVIEYKDVYYALINIDKCNKTGTYLHENSPYWFVLPSEIMGIKKVCNVPIDESVVSLFMTNPEISLLTNPKTHGHYIIPDSVYTMGSIKSTEFNSIFGNQKTKPYDNCGEYYFFYRSFITDDIGINRYALFVEGNFYLEENNECELTNEKIKDEYPEPCIIICYMKEHKIKPDMLVKKDDSFCCLSYHISEYENNELLISVPIIWHRLL